MLTNSKFLQYIHIFYHKQGEVTQTIKNYWFKRDFASLTIKSLRF